MNGHSWERITRQETKELLDITANDKRAKVINAKKLYKDKIISYVIYGCVIVAALTPVGFNIIQDLIRHHNAHESYTAIPEETICIGNCTSEGWFNPRWRRDMESSRPEWWSFGDGKHQYTTRDLMGRNI